MDLTHSFTVPAGIDETWGAFQDIESVAACFPGATVTSAEGDTFHGTVKVKLGPIALVYNGVGSFTERDQARHQLVIDAKGKDKRGNGTAGALVTATMAEVDGGTRVNVVTDLAITGKPAQFGRGVIQDVSNKLLGQFVACLQTKVGSDSAASAQDRPSEQTPAAAEVPGTPAVGAVAPSPVHEPPRPAAVPAAGPAPASSGGDDALDLGATVLPVLAKTYWRQAVAAVAAVVVVGALVRSLRRR